MTIYHSRASRRRWRARMLNLLARTALLLGVLVGIAVLAGVTALAWLFTEKGVW